ncbi:Hypothetical predicted protein [Olea europaea subsp. europaea]|uniref:Uncharacterized protein n=1 Tax=Olea europaea subsp. europaea TaxID=158383 RepID=A0A8S0VKG0_OLEEU|nr:Hypothetical predicted protein [Olea europaea subsp. europaea]
MIHTADIQDQESLAEELDEDLSLCDFPINADENDQIIKDLSKNHVMQSSPSNFFEFFSDLSSEMSHAEEIIFCGKLLPYKIQPDNVLDDIRKYPLRDDEKSKGTDRRRCQSSDELKIMRSNGTNTELLRSSKSLGFRSFRALKPRWNIFMFGSVKFPPEMDLQDIKNRQIRCRTGSIFPWIDAGEKAPMRRTDRRNKWGYDLLRVLSCRNHENVAVKASIGIMPRSM